MAFVAQGGGSMRGSGMVVESADSSGTKYELKVAISVEKTLLLCSSLSTGDQA